MNIWLSPLYAYQSQDGYRVGVLSQAAWRRAIATDDEARTALDAAYATAHDATMAAQKIIARLQHVVPHKRYMRRIMTDVIGETLAG